MLQSRVYLKFQNWHKNYFKKLWKQPKKDFFLESI